MKIIRLMVLMSLAVMLGQRGEGMLSRFFGTSKKSEVSIEEQSRIQQEAERKQKENFKKMIKNAYDTGLGIDNYSNNVTGEYFYSSNPHDPSTKSTQEKVAFLMGCLTIRDHSSLPFTTKNRTSMREDNLGKIIPHLRDLSDIDVYLDPELKNTIALHDLVAALNAFCSTLQSVKNTSDAGTYFENGDPKGYIIYDIKKFIAEYLHAQKEEKQRRAVLMLQSTGRGALGRIKLAQMPKQPKPQEKSADDEVVVASPPVSQPQPQSILVDRATSMSPRRSSGRQPVVTFAAQPPVAANLSTSPAATDAPVVDDDAVAKALRELNSKLGKTQKKIKEKDNGLKDKLEGLKKAVAG